MTFRYRPWIRAAMVSCPGAALLARRISPGPTILMYHRFSPDRRGSGHTIGRDVCEWQFRVIQKEATVWCLGDYFDALRSGEPIPRNLVVITVDDGYRDFYEVAFPVLRSMSLPATLFPVVSFIEGGWLWHDIVRWYLDHSYPGQYSVETSEGVTVIDSSSDEGKQQAFNKLSALCIRQQTQEKLQTLERLGAAVGAALPEAPPASFAPCNWSELEEMRDSDIEIGAHSMTHPILTKVDRATLEWEVAEPRRVFAQRLGVDVRSFCYPNGQPDDIDEAVVNAVERAGYRGAVVTQRRMPDYRPYQTSRIGTSAERADFLWKVRGWEQSVASLRGRLNAS